ncbi:uncharacterized protein LOC117660389 isoform X2 [Pantherophis guttatus]|uniref:Uncharacterized protein LOC117660389 isoform X2 n=1 Tax=Pantherophis guttatus TaxID=94885 RepID=A0A6P9AZL3_PANGU|nr:uncharacterized protein LOC117660389 isoform X2 [Pantherophis guttatus]
MRGWREKETPPPSIKMQKSFLPSPLLFIILSTLQGKNLIHDPYKPECVLRKMPCHPKAICQLDELSSEFYCRCLPGYDGDGISLCQAPAFHITVSDASVCDEMGEQVCLLHVKEPRVTFHVSVSASANRRSPSVIWYKFYTGQSPQFHSYRQRLGSVGDRTLRRRVGNRSRILTLLSIQDDDFYPNLFWAEVRLHALIPKTLGVEAYDLSRFQLLNPSGLRFYFALEGTSIVGPFLEGDTAVLRLPEYLHLSPSSFVQWIKEPRPLTLLDDQAVIIADEVEKMVISGLTESNFGYVRALVYDFHSEVPGRVLVAERLFLIKKEQTSRVASISDVTKTCEGSRGERSCRCNPGFEGRGVHCVDINECERKTALSCLSEATCTNTYGSYFCRCPRGLEGDGLVRCVDVDECTRGTHKCNQNALCLNTLGSYVCACQSGFIGDGSRCTAKSTWSPWSPWSPCSVTCGIQNQMRIRECTHEESGMRCLGPSADLKGCPNLRPCPTNGGWSVWSPWSVCLETCSGIKKRLRLCDSPPASRGGLPCKGEKEQLGLCHSSHCAVDGAWSLWASWTPCPVSCGLGVVRRSRRCNSPSPEHGGKNCSGHGYEEGTCGFPEALCRFLAEPSESIVPGKLIQ